VAGIETLAARVLGGGTSAAPTIAVWVAESIRPWALMAGSGGPLVEGVDSGAGGDGSGGVLAPVAPVIGSAEVCPTGLLSAVDVVAARVAVLDAVTGDAVPVATTGCPAVVDVTLDPTPLVSVTVGTATVGALACRPPDTKSSGMKLNPTAKRKTRSGAIVLNLRSRMRPSSSTSNGVGRFHLVTRPAVGYERQAGFTGPMPDRG
jgi:hypothetical protein